MYQDMVMTRYIERQLNHQRQLLSLELPEMLQNHSKSLNERLKRLLGIVDQPQPEDMPPGDLEEDELRGSAGDLLFDEAQQRFSRVANYQFEVVDALPSPACDTAKFAVISLCTCLPCAHTRNALFIGLSLSPSPTRCHS